MTVYVGEQMQAVPGAWGNGPTSFSYAWYSSDSGIGAGSVIAGHTRSDFIPGYDLVGKYVRVGVVATNAGGSSDEVFSSYELIQQNTPPPEYLTRTVTLLSGVKATTSDTADDFRDVDRGWSNWV